MTDLSSEAVSRNCPPPLPPSPDGDGENATDLTAAVCPLKSDDSPLAELTHTRTDLSREAEAIRRPEGEKAWGDEERVDFEQMTWSTTVSYKCYKYAKRKRPCCHVTVFLEVGRQ